jgi:hypothetical protein
MRDHCNDTYIYIYIYVCIKQIRNLFAAMLRESELIIAIARVPRHRDPKSFLLFLLKILCVSQRSSKCTSHSLPRDFHREFSLAKEKERKM